MSVIPPINENKISNPDYYIDAFKSKWEYKTVSSFNSIDNQLQDGCKQTSGEHVGIVVDISGLNPGISVSEAVMAIRYRMVKRAKNDLLDVIIKQEDNFIGAYRFRK